MGESYQLKNLNQRNRDVILLHVMGFRNNQIAEKLGYSVPTVSSIIHTEIAQAMIKELRSQQEGYAVDIWERLDEEAEASLEVLLALRDNTEVDSSLRAGISNDLLDRAGFKPPTKIIRKNEGDAQGLVSRIKQRAIEAKQVSDAEYEEVEDG